MRRLRIVSNWKPRHFFFAKVGHRSGLTYGVIPYFRVPFFWMGPLLVQSVSGKVIEIRVDDRREETPPIQFFVHDPRDGDPRGRDESAEEAERGQGQQQGEDDRHRVRFHAAGHDKRDDDVALKEPHCEGGEFGLSSGAPLLSFASPVTEPLEPLRYRKSLYLS